MGPTEPRPCAHSRDRNWRSGPSDGSGLAAAPAPEPADALSNGHQEPGDAEQPVVALRQLPPCWAMNARGQGVGDLMQQHPALIQLPPPCLDGNESNPKVLGVHPGARREWLPPRRPRPMDPIGLYGVELVGDDSGGPGWRVHRSPNTEPPQLPAPTHWGCCRGGLLPGGPLTPSLHKTTAVYHRLDSPFAQLALDRG